MFFEPTGKIILIQKTEAFTDVAHAGAAFQFGFRPSDPPRVPILPHGLPGRFFEDSIEVIRLHAHALGEELHAHLTGTRFAKNAVKLSNQRRGLRNAGFNHRELSPQRIEDPQHGSGDH